MKKTNTSKWLSTIVNIIDKVYEIWRKASDDFLKNPTYIKDTVLLKWKYYVKPIKI